MITEIYLAGFVESWGRGIEKICETCVKEGFPVPEFVINPGDIMIKFTSGEEVIEVGEEVVEVGDKVVEKVVDRVDDQRFEVLTDQEAELLELLRENPGYTYTDLANRMSSSKKTVYGRIKTLKKKGLIERVGSDAKGHWKLMM